MSTVPVK